MRDRTSEKNSTSKSQLKRSLGLFDAVAISIGATIGTGIFVVIGIVAGLAGPGLIFSLLIATAISLFTAISFSKLVMKIPKEGSVYEYTYQTISPLAGFLTGSIWVISNILTGSVVSLGFGHYLNILFPLISPNILAVIICTLFIILNILGAKYSALVNNILVMIKIGVLLFFIIFGALYINPSNFVPFIKWDLGIFYGAYFIFFAYGGFARVAVIAEEIKNPGRNVPRAMFISIFISTIIYVLVGLIAIGLIGTSNLSASISPLADAIQITGNIIAVYLVSIGALIATASVLLMSILGNSRMVYAMARRRDLPPILCKISRYKTPYLTILIIGAAMIVFILIIDIIQIIAVSTFALLFYYIMTNVAAFKIGLQKRSYSLIFPVLGTVTCILLIITLLFISPLSWIMGIIILVIILIVHQIKEKIWKKDKRI